LRLRMPTMSSRRRVTAASSENDAISALPLRPARVHGVILLLSDPDVFVIATIFSARAPKQVFCKGASLRTARGHGTRAEHRLLPSAQSTPAQSTSDRRKRCLLRQTQTPGRRLVLTRGYDE